MIKAGITGGIGSGKSTVCKMFHTLGAPIFHADQVAKGLYEDEQVKSLMLRHFGNDIFTEDGQVDKKTLAGKIFGDKEDLEFVQSIIHPRVRAAFSHWVSRENHFPYVLYEAAVLIESGYYRFLDKIILITAPEELRIQRVMERDKVTREDVMRRMENQWPEEKKEPFSDFLIDNSGETALIPQVLTIHQALTNQAKV